MMFSSRSAEKSSHARIPRSTSSTLAQAVPLVRTVTATWQAQLTRTSRAPTSRCTTAGCARTENMLASTRLLGLLPEAAIGYHTPSSDTTHQRTRSRTMVQEGESQLLEHGRWSERGKAWSGGVIFSILLRWFVWNMRFLAGRGRC